MTPSTDSGVKWQGEALRRYRVVADLSRRELREMIAERLQNEPVSEATMHEWERGTSNPTRRQLTALCAIFGCGPRAFATVPRLR